MGQKYYAGRRHASLAMARNATCSAARLVHLDLAGRYAIMALGSGEEPGPVVRRRPARPLPKYDVAFLPPAADRVDYGQLEAGARFLALEASTDAERQRHLDMADRYARLALDRPPEGER